MVTQEERERMRKLRAEGLSIAEIARIVGRSTGSVSTYVKDVRIPIGRYVKQLPIGIFEGSILDIETTGLDPKRDDLITFGSMVGREIKVMQRLDASADEFYAAIKPKIRKFPHPIYAYNAEFDKAFLIRMVGFEGGTR